MTYSSTLINLPFLGAYAPQTEEGNIVVEGILSSCYATATVPHDLAHIAMAPIWWFPEAMELIFGKTNEIQEYVNVLIDIEKMGFTLKQEL